MAWAALRQVGDGGGNRRLGQPGAAVVEALLADGVKVDAGGAGRAVFCGVGGRRQQAQQGRFVGTNCNLQGFGDGALWHHDAAPVRRQAWADASLHERAALRKFLEAWRGRPFTPEELKGFDLTKLLGQPCLLGIVHQEREGKTFAGISSCMKLPRGMTAPQASEPLECWDMSGGVPPDWTVFAALPKRLQETIEASAEFARLQPPKSVAVAPPQHAAAPAPLPPQPAPAGAAGSGFDDMDDDIAF